MELNFGQAKVSCIVHRVVFQRLLIKRESIFEVLLGMLDLALDEIEAATELVEVLSERRKFGALWTSFVFQHLDACGAQVGCQLELSFEEVVLSEVLQCKRVTWVNRESPRKELHCSFAS